jgi:hypothetical protein
MSCGLDFGTSMVPHFGGPCPLGCARPRRPSLRYQEVRSSVSRATERSGGRNARGLGATHSDELEFPSSGIPGFRSSRVPDFLISGPCVLPGFVVARRDGNQQPSCLRHRDTGKSGGPAYGFSRLPEIPVSRSDNMHQQHGLMLNDRGGLRRDVGPSGPREVPFRSLDCGPSRTTPRHHHGAHPTSGCRGVRTSGYRDLPKPG